jgi:ABC-type antimicrobial peptide transport system permease subunit
MNLSDILWLSFKDLKEKRVRTALTVLMVMIGVASIVALTSQTAGISASISSSLSALGPTSIIITPTSSTGFSGADAGLLSTLPNVSTVIPIITGSGTLYSNGQNTSVQVVGISQQGLQQLLGGLNLYQGTSYNDTIAPDALVGHSVAFPSSLSGAQNIKVGYPVSLKIGAGRDAETVTVPVVGILNSYGSSILSVDTSVALSIQSAEILLHRTSYNLILVKATNTSSVNALSSLITTIYGSKARILTTQQLLETTASIIGSISLLFAIIAGVSLLVAAVGIMNIMLIAVFERTHEIGIMKSVGFKSRHIMTIFLIQAMMIGFLGGIVGIIVGAGASYVVAGVFTHASSSTSSASTTGSSGAAAAGSSGGATYRSGGEGGFSGGGSTAGASAGSTGGFGSSSLSYSPVFTPITILAAVLVAVIVSIIAGIYPAWRASKMEPIDALREL